MRNLFGFCVAQGQVLAVNKTQINVKPVVFSLSVGFRF